ncbi:TIM21-domain-containing protein [Phaeosphaeriaceae sp. PMI808]|nr:TIM21-domain-containing protein [Phaeosphaeriaceae sp. PMI808]
MAAIYRPVEVIALLRPSFLLPRIQLLSIRRPLSRIAFSTSQPTQATHNSTPNPSPTPPRKKITLIGDTGQVKWSDLSPAEKVVRTTQQSFNLGVILIGILATAGVAYVLYTDVFSFSSKTAHFNRAVTLVRADSRCQTLLGPSNQIAAFSGASWARQGRGRFVVDSTNTDKWGTEHLQFKFYVEGPLGHGVVHVHLTKRPSQDDYEYQELAVDVKGHQRINLVKDEEKKSSKVAPKIFGARWW